MSLSLVWTPPPLSLPIPPELCVLLCVCMAWARHWLSPIPSSVTLTGPSRRAASLFPPDGTTAQLTPPSPANTTLAFDPQSAPLILMKGGWKPDLKKDESKDNQKRKKKKNKGKTQ